MLNRRADLVKSALVLFAAILLQQSVVARFSEASLKQSLDGDGNGHHHSIYKLVGHATRHAHQSANGATRGGGPQARTTLKDYLSGAWTGVPKAEIGRFSTPDTLVCSGRERCILLQVLII